MKVYLNIGSNSGDRRAFIGHAVAAVVRSLARPGVAATVAAPFYSAPWGYESEAEYINVGMMLDFPRRLSPGDLDAIYLCLRDIECGISLCPHRNPDGTYRDRDIDIDIIAAGDMVCHTALLDLPHPRMHLRDFVLVPLAWLDPLWTHPLLGRTAARLLGDLVVEAARIEEDD